jgi:hypothetical protein
MPGKASQAGILLHDAILRNARAESVQKLQTTWAQALKFLNGGQRDGSG